MTRSIQDLIQNLIKEKKEKLSELESSTPESIDCPILEEEIADCEYVLKNWDDLDKLGKVEKNTTSGRLFDMLGQRVLWLGITACRDARWSVEQHVDFIHSTSLPWSHEKKLEFIRFSNSGVILFGTSGFAKAKAHMFEVYCKSQGFHEAEYFTDERGNHGVRRGADARKHTEEESH